MMKQLTKKSSQKGFSVLGVVVIILLASFFGTLTVKLAPIYNDHWYLTNVVQEISVTNGTDKLSTFELADRLKKNLMVNNVNFDVKKGFKVDKSTSPKRIILDYSKQVHIMLNVEALVSFHEEYTLQP